MFKNYLIVFSILSCAFSNIFFSEYAEGNSNNKFLEIFNGGSESVDLGNYTLSSCSNGCDDGVNWDYPDNVTFDANTTLLPNEVYVVCHGSADAIIQAECDQTFTYLSNGNDVFGLTTTSGELIDVIGEVGDDPGDGWDVAGVTNATKDHTLVRMPTVNSGNGGDWYSSAGTTDSDSEWMVYSQNEWSYLGFHICNACGEGGNQPMLFIQSPSNGEVVNSSDFSITFSVFNFELGEDGYINYQLNGNAYQIDNSGPIEILDAIEGDYNLSMELVDMDENVLDPPVEAEINFTVLLPSLTQIADIQDNYDFYEGQTVIVQGTVTIGDGLLFPGRTKFYIQDDSGKGIQIYHSTEITPFYQRGDYIEVSGVVDSYNDDVEITEPNITLLNTGQSLPNPYNMTGAESLDMNGTWSIASGELIDYWHYVSGTTEFTALTIALSNGNEVQSMFWNSAVPATELAQFEQMVGEQYSIYGVVAFYNGTPQLTCGYMVDIVEFVDLFTPVANAGQNQTVAINSLVELNGEMSTDPNGVIVGYLWNQISGPTVSLGEYEEPIVTFTAPSEACELEFSLVVTDNEGNESNADIVQITVNNIENINENILPNETTITNYPNPFNPSTTITVNMEKMESVNLNLFDLNGRLISNLISNKLLETGTHEIQLYGHSLHSGVYILDMTTESNKLTKMIHLIK